MYITMSFYLCKVKEYETIKKDVFGASDAVLNELSLVSKICVVQGEN